MASEAVRAEGEVPGPGSSRAVGRARRSAGGRRLVAWPTQDREFPRVGASASTLATALESISVGDADDVRLLDAVLGWQQLVGVAVAGQARVIRELYARGYELTNGLPDELAAALAWTRRAAQELVARAEGLGELPALDAALCDGRLDVRKVDLILDEVATLVLGSDELPDREEVDRARARVAELAARDGGDLTPTQLRRTVRREVLAVDPAATRERTRRAIEDRTVTVGWAPDGMAWVNAFLPAADALLVRTVLDAATDQGDALDDRSRDQRRADLFVRLFEDVADTGRLPCGRALPSRRGVRPHIQVTMAHTTLLGLDDLPAELAGHGPIPAELARTIASDGTWRRILTDPADGTFVERSTSSYRPGVVLGAQVVARDVTCTFPGCVRTAASGELDHIEPYRADRVPSTHGSSAPSVDQTRAENLQAVCKRHHDLKTAGLWKVRRDLPDGGVSWTSPLGITYAVDLSPVHGTPETWRHVPAPPPRCDEPPPF